MASHPDLSTKGIYSAPVLSIENLVARIYLLRLHCPEIARTSTAGQFINIKVNDEYIPLLRKPFSICRLSAHEGWIEVLWEVIGKGTKVMAGYHAGDRVNILGPLGRGYTISPALKVAYLVGGGLGVAPLPLLCHELLAAGRQVVVFLGARSEDALSMVDAIQELGVEVYVSTEDGSVGKRGLVTDILTEHLTTKPREGLQLFSCGPMGFLRRMIEITHEFDIEGQISIETMMGCGFGICVGCPVQARSSDDQHRYFLTCLDGPVFDAREVILHD